MDGQCIIGWGGVMSVCIVNPEYFFIWQVQVSVYCARRIPAQASV